MDILSNINVQGDISFSGNIIGNIPGASISTEAYNSIKNINGLYSSFGYEDIPSDKINDHGTLSISESQSLLGTIMGRTKPSTVVCDKWFTELMGSNASSSIFTIPTHEGKYMIMSSVPFDQNGTVGNQIFYMKDDSSVVFPYSFTLTPNDQINSWLTEDGSKTNYNNLISTGRHKVQGVSESELSSYNAPFASIDPVVVYVQSDLAQPQGSRPVSQFVISNTGVYYRTGTQYNMPATWTNLVSTYETPISALSDNLIQSKSDGLYVSGKAPIIPKLSNVGFTMLLSTPDKTFNNAVRYSDTFAISNPVGANSFGGISLYNVAEMKLNHYFVDASNNILDAKVDYLITSTTSSVVNFKIFLTIYGTPTALYSLADDSAWPPDGGIVNIPISCKILLGTTPSALGY